MDFGYLDLRHLRLVRAIVEEGSLTAAAERLALSQPALSHQLHDIEDKLGVALFDRRGRSLLLTRAGERVLAAARFVLDEVHRTETDLAAFSAGRKGTLRVAAECYTTYHWLPDVLQAFGREYPEVNVELAAEATEKPGEAVAARALDVALVTLVDRLGDGLMATPLFEDEVVAVVPDTHPWAEAPFVDPHEFDGKHVFTYQTCQEQDCVLRLVRAAEAVPARITPIPLSTEAVVGLVRAGHGVTYMARWAAQPYLERGGLAAVPISAFGLHRTWYAVRRDESRPKYVDAFTEVLARAESFNTLLQTSTPQLACV